MTILLRRFCWLTASKRNSFPCYARTLTSVSPTAPKTVELVYGLHLPRTVTSKEELPDDTAPIVFMHGLFGSKLNNRSISKNLANKLNRPIYTLDLRNHGESPHHPIHTYEAMADDVENFLRIHNLRNSTLMGHSMGAKVAMAVALRSPDLLQDIIAIDNAPVNAQLGRQFANYVRAMRTIEDKQLTRRKEADAIFGEYEKSLDVRQFLMTNLLMPHAGEREYIQFRVPVKTLQSALDNMAGFPFKPGVDMFKKPALFVRGTKSKYVSDETIPLIGEFFPKFELRDVEAGHWLVSENPAKFIDTKNA